MKAKTIVLLGLPLLGMFLGACGGSSKQPQSFRASLEDKLTRLEKAPSILKARGELKKLGVSIFENERPRARVRYEEDVNYYDRHKSNDTGPDYFDCDTEYANIYNFLNVTEYIGNFKDKVEGRIGNTDTYNVWIQDPTSSVRQYRIEANVALGSFAYEEKIPDEQNPWYSRNSIVTNEEGQLVYTEEVYSIFQDPWWEGEERFTYDRFRYVEGQSYELFSFQRMMKSDVEFNRWYTRLDFQENVVKCYQRGSSLVWSDGRFVSDDKPPREDYYEMDLNGEDQYKIMAHASIQGPWTDNDEYLEYRVYDEQLRNVNLRNRVCLFAFKGIESVTLPSDIEKTTDSYTGLPITIVTTSGKTIDTLQEENFPTIVVNVTRDEYGKVSVRPYFQFVDWDPLTEAPTEKILKNLKDKYGIELDLDLTATRNRIKQGQDQCKTRFRDKAYMAAFETFVERNMKEVDYSTISTLSTSNLFMEVGKDELMPSLKQNLEGKVAVKDGALDFSGFTIKMGSMKLQHDFPFFIDLYLVNRLDQYLVASQSVPYVGEEVTFPIDFGKVNFKQAQPAPGEYECKILVRGYEADPVAVALKGENIDFTDENGYVYSLKQDGTMLINVKSTLN